MDSNIYGIVNGKRFQNLNELDDNIVEVETTKHMVKLNVPIQIGYFVLEYGKLILLSFYYDFLVKFLSFDDFSLIDVDTDGIYFSLSKNNVFECVPQHKQSQFVKEYEFWFAKDYCDLHKDKFFSAMFKQVYGNQSTVVKKLALEQ